MRAGPDSMLEAVPGAAAEPRRAEGALMPHTTRVACHACHPQLGVVLDVTSYLIWKQTIRGAAG